MTEKKIILDVPYSDIEVRVAAALNKVSTKPGLGAQRSDVIGEMASEVFGVAQDELTPDQRRQVKSAAFRHIYSYQATSTYVNAAGETVGSVSASTITGRIPRRTEKDTHDD